MSVKLAYGIRNEHIIHISEIAPSENGKNCNCVCPVCGGILYARLGHQNQHHFSHEPGSNCDVSKAQQTGLHLLAKEIIQTNKRILVPGFSIPRHEVIGDCKDTSAAAEVAIDLPNIQPLSIDYDSVEIEKAFDGIIADAVITINKTICIVEIAVTHYVDNHKRQKLASLNLPAFEIDLSDLLDTPQPRESIKDAVLLDCTNRYWVFNPKRDRLLNEKKAEFQNKYNVVVKARELAEKRKQEYRQNNLLILRNLMVPENYTNELNRLRNDEQAARWLKQFSFAKSLTEYPFYMDIPITGEFVFSCDRRIWQAKLFEDYIYRGFGQEICIFSISKIRKRISKEHLIIRYDKQKTYRTTVFLNGQEKEVSFSYDVVQRYFDYLDLLGFVSHVGYEWFSKRPVSLNPPNQTAANELKSILQSVDRSSPNIDQIIKRELLSKLGEDEKRIVLTWDKQEKNDHT